MLSARMNLQLVRDSISDAIIDDQTIVSPEHDGFFSIFFRVYGAIGIEKKDSLSSTVTYTKAKKT